MENLKNFNNQSRLQQQLDFEKKEKLRRDNEENLQRYFIKKEAEKRNKMADASMIPKLLEEENSRMNQPHSDYMNKITSMNNRIYNNARRLNKFITGNESDLYSNTNDIEYNKKLAEMHLKEKHDQLYSPDRNKIQLEIAKQNQEYKEYMYQNKLNMQKDYKDFLDHQRVESKSEINKKNTFKESGEQLLMPGYRYPNLPVPLGKKAFDSLNYMSRTPAKKDLYSNDPLGMRQGYLGDTRLRHNPIINPIEDMEYNKYVSRRIPSMIPNNPMLSKSVSYSGNNPQMMERPNIPMNNQGPIGGYEMNNQVPMNNINNPQMMNQDMNNPQMNNQVPMNNPPTEQQ